MVTNQYCGDKPVLVARIGEINFGKQFRQCDRVYDSEHIVMWLLAQPVGNTGENKRYEILHN